MVGPAQKLLRIRINKLRKKDPVERGVLTDEERLFTPDVPLGEQVDDLLGRVAG